jgi:hypothetical protein
MQSKTTRGLRRLFVSTGVISLVLSVAAPALASPPEGVGKKQDLRVELSGPLSADGKRMWVCHETSSGTNPLVGIWVNVNARGHLVHDDDVDMDDLDLMECPPELPPVLEDSVIVIPPGDGTRGQSDGDGVGDGTGGQSDDKGGSDGAGAESGNNDGSDSTDTSSEEPKKGETIISTVTVTRPAPATPAVPATPAAPTVPADPATPQAPATPAAQAVTNAPAARTPSVAVSATSRGNEVLGSVTTRTPGGTKVTALAATGTSTTVALAALGVVLLLAGLGLQLGARRRVRSSDVGA